MSLTADQLAQAIDYLCPNAAYTRYDTYANLSSSWTDTSTTCPTETELETAWTTINTTNQITALNEEYAGKFLSIDRSLALISVDSTRTSDEKSTAITALATVHATLKSELLTKQEAVING